MSIAAIVLAQPTKKRSQPRRSPSALSAELMRDNGWHVETVERYIPGAGIRKDLFGFIDLLGINDAGDVLAVQATSKSNVNARVKKITEAEALPMVRKAGWRIEVHGWYLESREWKKRVVDLS